MVFYIGKSVASLEQDLPVLRYEHRYPGILRLNQAIKKRVGLFFRGRHFGHRG
jgi:hypothetical protein